MSLSKPVFARQLRERYFLRCHMSLILLVTGFSGVFFSRLLLSWGVENFVLRYPLVVVLAYLVFFLCVKLWLWYVSPPRPTSSSHILDGIDLPTGGPGGSLPIRGGGTFTGGGGQFSGAGASSSFEAPGTSLAESPFSSAPESFGVFDSAGGAVGESGSSMVDGIGDAVGDAVGEAAGALGEEGGLAAIVVLGALAVVVVAVLGSTVYLVSEAPMILTEAAFDGMLAVSLFKKTKLIDESDWVGSIFRTTWIPFGSTLAVSLVAALVLHHYYPTARMLADILK
jgi:hypothetical protein